ncbi:MAG: hypothetical protein K2M87_01250 [Muribaculaceae bacterium]|nr:hypothetical protein [Muribaculaceae bacterium]
MGLSDIITLLGSLLGLVTGIGGLGVFLYHKQNKRLKDAEAKAAEVAAANAERTADEARIKALHDIIELNNKTEIEHAARIADLNHQCDELRDRNHKLSDRLYDSESECNRLNDEKAALLAENGRLKLELEKKRCDKLKCGDRQPPNAYTPVPVPIKEETPG